MSAAATARLRYGVSGRQSQSRHGLVAPFVMSLDEQPVLQHIRLPSVSNSPTIPRPDVSSVNPQDMNFPRVCASPSHVSPPSLMAQSVPTTAAAPVVLSHRLFA